MILKSTSNYAADFFVVKYDNIKHWRSDNKAAGGMEDNHD